MNSFPYPVLTQDDSAYCDKSFSLTFLDCGTDNNTVSLRFAISLDSETLKDYIIRKDAKIVVKIQSELISETIDVVSGENVVIEKDFSSFKDNDLIKVTAYVIANTNFVYVWNNELVDVYPQDMTVPIRKKDILAISNTEKLDYSIINPDFIKFKTLDDYDEGGFSINLNNENFIEIIIGSNFNRAYATIKGNKILSAIFDSHIIFEVFVFLLVEIFQNKEQYYEKEWYRLFDNMMKHIIGESIDDTEKKAKAEDIDMKVIYSISHKLINNQIEVSLVNASLAEV